MFNQQTNVMKKVSYLDNVSSELVNRKVISYKIKTYHETDGSISFGVVA
jgi:hypothetical protein